MLEEKVHTRTSARASCWTVAMACSAYLRRRRGARPADSDSEGSGKTTPLADVQQPGPFARSLRRHRRRGPRRPNSQVGGAQGRRRAVGESNRDSKFALREGAQAGRGRIAGSDGALRVALGAAGPGERLPGERRQR